MDLRLANLQQTICKVAITVLQTGDELLPETNGETNKNLASFSFSRCTGYARPCKCFLGFDVCRYVLLFGRNIPTLVRQRSQMSLYFCGAESPKSIKVGKRSTQLVEVSSAIQQRNDVHYISQNHTTFINVLVIMDNQINIRVRRRISIEAKITPPKRKKPTMGNERK